MQYIFNNNCNYFYPRLALQSCIEYKNGIGYIDKKYHQTKVDIMFKKKIKMLIANITEQSNAFLVTQDVEKYVWMEDTSAKTFNFEVQSTDNEVENVVTRENLSHYICYTSHKIDWSNTRIVKAATNTSNFLLLTEDGKIYYTHNSIEGKEKECSIHQLNTHEMNIKEQITSMSCGYNCYVIATNSRTFFWGFIYNDREDSSHDSAEYMCRNSWFKIACGIDYTLALTNEGKLYCWGGPYFYETTFCSNHCGNNDISPIQMNIINVKNLSDIAVINYTNFVKSSKNELVYAWGFIFKRRYKEPAVCEYTNAFDISNSMTAHSPVSVAGEFINEEFHILNDLETAFNDQVRLYSVCFSNSVFPMKYHKNCNTIYFYNLVLNLQKIVIVNNYYRYIVYKKFLEYLYTGMINLSSFKNLLGEFELNVELMKYCFHFYFKNMATVIQTEGFEDLDVKTKAMLMNKGYTFLSSEINSSGYLE
ncbi:RCBT2 protein, partial [Acromyrmex insinuator]